MESAIRSFSGADRLDLVLDPFLMGLIKQCFIVSFNFFFNETFNWIFNTLINILAHTVIHIDC